MNYLIDVTPKQDGGVLKKIIQEGVGDELPPNGCKILVHYNGTFLDGTTFDSSRDRKQPFSFDLGKGSVIRGWDIGVGTMKKGERALLTCTPEYAYGVTGSPPTIPPNSTLQFDIEVIEWMGEDISPNKDDSIEKIQLIQGEGYTSPNEGSVVNVHLTGTFENRQFDDREVTFTVGEGSEENIIPGIEIAIKTFKKNEKSRLKIKPCYAFGINGSSEYNIPQNATIEYEVLLKNFERVKESWALDFCERIEQSHLFKENGTKYYKVGKYELALKMYKRIHSYLESDSDKEKQTERSCLLIASYLNASLCQLKLKEYFEAKDSATLALNIDPNNEKALFRRGEAFLYMGEPQSASQDFKKCLKINPANSAAKRQLIACGKLLKEQVQKEKQIYAYMFDKFAKTDTQREENEKKTQPNVLSSVGEWGQEDREREPSEFEKENPDILLLNGTGEFKDM